MKARDVAGGIKKGEPVGAKDDTTTSAYAAKNGKEDDDVGGESTKQLGTVTVRSMKSAR